MNEGYKEALRECCIHLAESQGLIEEMEQLIAKAHALSIRGDTPGKRWQAHANSVLRRLRQEDDEKEGGYV